MSGVHHARLETEAGKKIKTYRNNTLPENLAKHEGKIKFVREPA